jgi:molybdenum cofactor biosynthesis enzyme MoaA
MKLKLFNKEIELNDHHCNFNDESAKKINVPYINLYVRITDSCQARCKFCEFHEENYMTFDLYKFLYTFAKLNNQVKINKVSFTGGEPTMKIDTLNRCLREVKELNPEVFTIVNTNGFALDKINGEYVDSIALSRHSVNDAINQEIFGTTAVPCAEFLKSYKYKDKLHLSCNLIRGYTDNNGRCRHYIETFGNMGITDIGFVSLMGINKYAEDKFLDFADVKLETMHNTVSAAHWQKQCGGKPTCKCANYLTYTETGVIVKSYARYYADRSECKGMLVYERNGQLKAGFNGVVINE